jgi:hypothetical protein
VKTTIELPDDLFRKLEKQAAQKGVDVAQFVTLAVTLAVNTSLNPAHQPAGAPTPVPHADRGIDADRAAA